MCSGTIVVMRVRAQHMTQMTLAEHDHMIEAFASDRADQSFGIAVLPWRSRRCRSIANAHRSNAARKRLAIDAVPITNQVSRRWVPAAGLRDLASDPFGGRMGGDAKPHNSPAAVSENEQSV